MIKYPVYNVSNNYLLNNPRMAKHLQITRFRDFTRTPSTNFLSCRVLISEQICGFNERNWTSACRGDSGENLKWMGEFESQQNRIDDVPFISDAG